MLEFLRFPDAIEYEQVIKNCNLMAKPIGTRTVTNKCYILLWKATYFSSSVFIGTRHVLDTLQTMKEEPVPCLVMLAADTFIDAPMLEIVSNCKQRDIPYIFIPTKYAMRDALNVDNEVLAVMITFNHDPGMRREFEDCFVSMRSQCFKKKKKHKREHGAHSTASATAPPEIGPRGEMPQQVSTESSTVPMGENPAAAGSSSGSDWKTISTDTESSDSDSSEHGSSRDFSVNVPDESGSSFQEYVRIPSPTPAPSPSEMAAQQKLDVPSTVEESSAACSSDESVRPGPSREFLIPTIKRRQLSPHRQTTWPIPLPYAPKENLDDERIRMYLQTICKTKKLRLRSKTSCPPTCITPTPPSSQSYMQYSNQPSTSTQSTSAPEPPAQPEPIIDIDSDDLTFRWTMDDLSSTPSEQTIDLTSSPTNDPGVHEISSDDDVLMIEESSNIENEGAAGDGNICSVDLTTSCSSESIVIPDAATGDEDSSQSQIVPPLLLEEPSEGPSDTTSTADMESPQSPDLDEFRGAPTSARSSNTETSSSSSGEIINLQPSSSSSLFGSGDSPSVMSLAEEFSNVDASHSETNLLADLEDPPPPDDVGNPPSADAQDAPSTSRGDVPAVHATSGEVGDAAVIPSASRGALGAAGEGAARVGEAAGRATEGPSRMGFPSAFGDVGIGDGNTWPMRPPRNPDAARYRHRVTGTGEGNQSPFMPSSMSFIFAPRIVYTAAASDDGLRRPHQLPREEDLLAINFPVDDDDDEDEEDDEDGEYTGRRSGSLDVNPSDDSSEDESELSPEPPTPFELAE